MKIISNGELYPTLVCRFVTVSLPPGLVEHSDWTSQHSQQDFR